MFRASCADRNPALYAAAISPLEWPQTTYGRISQDRSRSTRAIWRAVQQGCEIALSEMRVALASLLSSSRSRHSAPMLTRKASDSARDEANTGYAASSCPIRAH